MDFCNPEIWHEINPQCSIETKKPLRISRQYKLDADCISTHLSSILKDGYFHISRILNEKDIQSLLSCIGSIISKELPPVFAFMYDEPWKVILKLSGILEKFLGKDFLILPNVWTWYIDPKKPELFPPRRDQKENFIDEKGYPNLLSLWIPLTRVTTNHSCLYLLPGSWDPEYPSAESEKIEKNHLSHIRALPAKKGSLLAWNGGILHWGSKPDENTSPSISIGYYFQSQRAKEKKSDFVDLKKPFSLEKRFQIIAEVLRTYGQPLPTSIPQF